MEKHFNKKEETYSDLKESYLNNKDNVPGKLIEQKLSQPIIELSKTGLKLKKLREDNNLTRKELASMLNTSYPTISNWENSKKLPNIDTLLKISQLFNIHVEDLVNNASKNEPVSLDDLLDALEKRDWFLSSTKGNGRRITLTFKKIKSLYDESLPYTKKELENNTSIIFDIFKLVKIKKWVHVKTTLHWKSFVKDEIVHDYVKSVKVVLNRKYLTTDYITPSKDLDKIMDRLLTLDSSIVYDIYTPEHSITLGKNLIGQLAVENDEHGLVPYEGIYIFDIDGMEVPFIFNKGNLDGNEYEDYFSYFSQTYDEVIVNPFPAIYYTKKLKSGKTMEVKEYWKEGLPQYIIVNDGEYLETWDNGELIAKRGKLPE